MQLVLRRSDLGWGAMEDYVERRLRFALGRFGDRVRTVWVSLRDQNGPRGGPDKQCRIEVDGGRELRVVTEETHADLHFAIDRAAERTGRSFARALGRVKKRR